MARVRLRFAIVCLCSFGRFSLDIILQAVAWVRLARRAPEVLCSREVMNRVLRMLLWEAPSDARWSASSFPLIPEWPLTHSKEVVPVFFCYSFLIHSLTISLIELRDETVQTGNPCLSFLSSPRLN